MGDDRVDELQRCVDELENNQQEILQTLNNGLKSKTKSTEEKVSNLEDRFNKLLLAIGGGMFTIILLLIQIMIQTGG